MVLHFKDHACAVVSIQWKGYSADKHTIKAHLKTGW
jgi:hypothetical protein